MNTQDKIKVGITGAAGYTGGELIRILLNHPNAVIAFAHSKSNAGKKVYEVHTDLLGETDIVFSTQPDFQNIDVLFLCVGHGESHKFMSEFNISEGIKLIDLSQDFRLAKNKKYNNREFVYGLPELNRDRIAKTTSVANPGCFATCIQLSLLPAASKNLLKGEVHITAVTGSTGAGQSLSPTTHFTWRANNLSIYKAFEHQHLNEILESVKQLQSDFIYTLNFVPYRGDFTRGIIATTYFDSDLSVDEVIDTYSEYYSNHPFTFISEKPIDLKQVVNTNKCFIHIGKYGSKIMITGIIDNLLKGASGQAVQNMNILFGLNETSGLKLKANAF